METVSKKNNILSPIVAKELAIVRKKVEKVKKLLSDFIDEKDINMAERADDIENAVCEQSTDTESRITDIENALCDLSEMLFAE